MFSEAVLKRLDDVAEIGMPEIGNKRPDGAGPLGSKRFGRSIGNPPECSHGAFDPAP